MNASSHTAGSAWVLRALIIGLGIAILAATTGCDTTSQVDPAGLYPQGSLGAISTWGGLANPGNTSSIGLPQSPASYWAALGYF